MQRIYAPKPPHHPFYKSSENNQVHNVPNLQRENKIQKETK